MRGSEGALASYIAGQRRGHRFHLVVTQSWILPLNKTVKRLRFEYLYANTFHIKRFDVPAGEDNDRLHEALELSFA